VLEYVTWSHCQELEFYKLHFVGHSEVVGQLPCAVGATDKFGWYCHCIRLAIGLDRKFDEFSLAGLFIIGDKVRERSVPA
jgi:hypothetical protein